MHYDSPLAFLLLLLIPVIIWLRQLRFKGGSLRFSSIRNAAKTGRSFRQRIKIFPALLRVLALILLILAISRPQKGTEQIRETSKGVAIEMIVDRSGSMGAEMEFGRARMNRLDVVKRVFEEFVMGNEDDLNGRPDDLIGMIVFARYANTVCPLTLAHGALPQFLKTAKLVQNRAEDGTAIGDALALGAARLKKADEAIAKQRVSNKKAYEIKSKAIILLSDGENNCGKRDPLMAAELAKKWGIKIYTIAIGGGQGVATIQTPFGAYKVPMGAGVDTETLKQISEITGGFFRKAEDAKSLYSIYKEIDKMEKTEIESVRFVDYKESFSTYALAALFMLVVEIILNCTFFRKIP